MSMKKHLSTRVMAVFLALVMCLGMLPTAAFAVGEETAPCPVCQGLGQVEADCAGCDGTGRVVTGTVSCPACGGEQKTLPCAACVDGKVTRTVTEDVDVDCEVCGGSGQVTDLETGDPALCAACEGVGTVKGTASREVTEDCQVCGGSGETEAPACETCGGTGTVQETTDCQVCGGTGTVTEPCSNCSGSGEIAVKHEEDQAPSYATLDELDAAFETVGEVLESGDIQAGINALDAYIAIYDRLSPEDQETNAEALASAQAYRETLVAALEADEEDEESNDPEINTLNWFEPNTNAYHITDSPLSDDVQNQIDASNGKFILYVQTNVLTFNQPLTIPRGKTVEVYDYGTDRTIKRSGDHPLFIVEAGGGLTIGGGRLTLDGGSSTTQNSLLVVKDGGTLTLKDNLRVMNGKTTLNGGGVYVHDGGTLTIQDSVSFSECSATNGSNVYVECGAGFTNSANISGVFDGNTGSSSHEEFQNKPVYVTVNKNAYEGLPGEPSIATGTYYWLTDRDSNPLWGSDYAITQNPGTFLKEEILDSEYYIKSTSDNTYGVADPTGQNTKSFVKDRSIWNRFLDVLADSDWAKIQVLDINDNPIPLTPQNKYQYEVVPYVIKYQRDFSEGWHIDCAVVPKDRIQVDYDLNLPNGMSTEKSFGVPTGSVSFGPIRVSVEALTYNGKDVTTKSDPIEAKYDQKDVHLSFLG